MCSRSDKEKGEVIPWEGYQLVGPKKVLVGG